LSTIRKASSFDARYQLPGGAGSDAVHANPEYCFAVTLLRTDTANTGVGIALTLGEGNRIVCELIDLLAAQLVGKEIEELMADFGVVSRSLANHPQLRWLGPHKGAVHLALASVTNACFDLWAKVRGVPLWKLLLDLSPAELIATLDLSGIEDVLSPEVALNMLQESYPTRSQREGILASGYPGYDTSVGWFGYDDVTVKDKAQKALESGFNAFKLKVGSSDPERDIRRAYMLRELVGQESLMMLDANQQWSFAQAESIAQKLQNAYPLWIEEPIHPDDILGHRELARSIRPIRVALGEHVPNRVLFKNFMQLEAVHYVQVDCTRVAGVNEFIATSLLARQFDLPVIPHVGDMGQIHQHLVLFNHIACGLPAVFLEYIPHVRDHFVHPAKVEGGRYRTPEESGASSDLREAVG
jgi:L-fuconate dehydratase